MNCGSSSFASPCITSGGTAMVVVAWVDRSRQYRSISVVTDRRIAVVDVLTPSPSEGTDTVVAPVSSVGFAPSCGFLVGFGSLPRQGFGEVAFETTIQRRLTQPAIVTVPSATFDTPETPIQSKFGSNTRDVRRGSVHESPRTRRHLVQRGVHLVVSRRVHRSVDSSVFSILTLDRARSYMLPSTVFAHRSLFKTVLPLTGGSTGSA